MHFHEFMLEVQDRLHRRREELAAKGAPPEADTIVPIAKQIAQRDAAALLRRVPGHQHRRRHDPGAPVRGAVRRGPHRDRHVQPQARRSLQGRPAARALPALHRPGEGAARGARAGRRPRLPPGPAAQLRRLSDAARRLGERQARRGVSRAERRRRRRAARAAHPGPRRRDPARRAGRRHGAFPRLVCQADGRRRLHLHRRPTSIP